MTSSGRFVTVFLYALYRIVLVFRHLFFCNVRAANLLWPETSGLITASRVHGQVSYSGFLNIFSPCLFNRSLNNATNLFPFLFNHEAGKLIIFSRILQFIVCQRGKKSYLQSWARALLPLLPGPHYCVFKSMRFRYHGKRIDHFASTLQFWSVFDCPN